MDIRTLRHILPRAAPISREPTRFFDGATPRHDAFDEADVDWRLISGQMRRRDATRRLELP
jgi:hypothetical protein